MPTSAQHTWGMATRLDPLFHPEDLRTINVALAPSLTLARGTVLGELSATPGTYKAYANGNTDGSQVAKGILAYAVTTDGSGNVTMIGEHGATVKHALMYMPCGAVYKTSELTGMDAAAVTDFGAALIQGDLTSGIIKI